MSERPPGPSNVPREWALSPRTPGKWWLWAILAGIAVVLVVLAVLPHDGGPSSDVGTAAAGACIRVADAGRELAGGHRSLASFRSEVAGAERTARTAAEQNGRYQPILDAIVAIRDDLDRGSGFASPLGYLDRQCER